MASNAEEEREGKGGGEESGVPTPNSEERGLKEEGALLVQKALNEAVIASGLGGLVLSQENEEASDSEVETSIIITIIVIITILLLCVRINVI